MGRWSGRYSQRMWRSFVADTLAPVSPWMWRFLLFWEISTRCRCCAVLLALRLRGVHIADGGARSYSAFSKRNGGGKGLCSDDSRESSAPVPCAVGGKVLLSTFVGPVPCSGETSVVEVAGVCLQGRHSNNEVFLGPDSGTGGYSTVVASGTSSKDG